MGVLESLGGFPTILGMGYNGFQECIREFLAVLMPLGLGVPKNTLKIPQGSFETPWKPLKPFS